MVQNGLFPEEPFKSLRISDGNKDPPNVIMCHGGVSHKGSKSFKFTDISSFEARILHYGLDEFLLRAVYETIRTSTTIIESLLLTCRAIAQLLIPYQKNRIYSEKS